VTSRAAPVARTVEQLLAAKEIVIVCGSGGVGKTTTAAALGTMAATHLGGKVLVLTVDPARRLAAALGLESFGNIEVRVPAELFSDAGVQPKGELWAAMLDTKQSWDDLVREHAPDDRTRDVILANPLYTNITGKFVQSHDYIAMERLYEIHASGRYDLVIVDTPPTRNALDFLDAPARMAEFFGGRLLRWLTVPYRSRLVTRASKPFYSMADRALGTKFLQDIADFFSLFQTMEKGFVQRSQQVTRVLSDSRTTFCVVSTLEPSPLREAEFFVRELGARHLHLGALVLNKVLPDSLLDPTASRAASALRTGAPALAVELAPVVAAEPAQVERVLVEVADSFDNFQIVAMREAEQRADLATAPEVTVAVPFVDADIHDLAGLARLGASLWR
jgi:anion-transporting  ArsA/GET3 family ATPase